MWKSFFRWWVARFRSVSPLTSQEEYLYLKYLGPHEEKYGSDVRLSTLQEAADLSVSFYELYLTAKEAGDELGKEAYFLLTKDWESIVTMKTGLQRALCQQFPDRYSPPNHKVGSDLGTRFMMVLHNRKPVARKDDYTDLLRIHDNGLNPENNPHRVTMTQVRVHRSVFEGQLLQLEHFRSDIADLKARILLSRTPGDKT